MGPVDATILRARGVRCPVGPAWSRGIVAQVLKRMGSLTNDDVVTKTLRGAIDAQPVWIQLDDSEPRITKVSVQARTRGGAPNVDLASEVDKQIYGYLITH